MGLFGTTKRKSSQKANLAKQKRRLLKKIEIAKMKADVQALKKKVGEF